MGASTSRWQLQGNATLGLRAGGRGHHLFFLPHKMVCPLSAFEASAFEGGLNRSTQHSILKGKDGVFGNASRLFSRLYGIGENRALGSLAAGRVAESDWTSVW